MNLNLSAPTVPVFVVSLVIVAIAILMVLGVVPTYGLPTFWVAVVGYVVLLLGNLLKNM